jgi:hypothetical protein
VSVAFAVFLQLAKCPSELGFEVVQAALGLGASVQQWTYH